MKIFLRLAITTALIQPVLAQETATQPAPAPNITIEEPTFNFGQKDNSQTVDHTFIIKNTGNLSLTIKQTKTSCGCTVANLSRKIVPPGETAELTARLSLKNRRGKQRKNITVVSDDPDTPTLQLVLEGEAIASLTITPDRLFMNGLKPDSEEVRSVQITSNNKPVNILKINNPLKEVEATLETIREGYEYKLHVKTIPPLPTGRFQNHIRLNTDHPSHSQLSVLVMGEVQGALAFGPPQLVLHLQTTNALTRYVVVRPGTTSEFTITNIDVPDENIQAKTFPMGKNGYRIQLQNLVARPELNNTKIVVHTDVEAMPKIEIPVIIKGLPPQS